jgi:hypothetical protein
MYGDHNNRSTSVIVDVTPVSVQCYSVDKCPAIQALQNEMPSVKIETMIDGMTVVKCPLSVYARVQATVQTLCFGCRARLQ